MIAGIHQVTTHPLYSCATATDVPSHARYHTPCLSKRCVFSGSQWQRFVLFLQVQIFWIGGTFQSQCLASLLRSADAQCGSCALLSWPQRRRRRTKPKVRCDSYSRNFGKGSSLGPLSGERAGSVAWLLPLNLQLVNRMRNGRLARHSIANYALRASIRKMA